MIIMSSGQRLYRIGGILYNLIVVLILFIFQTSNNIQQCNSFTISIHQQKNYPSTSSFVQKTRFQISTLSDQQQYSSRFDLSSDVFLSNGSLGRLFARSVVTTTNLAATKDDDDEEEDSSKNDDTNDDDDKASISTNNSNNSTESEITNNNTIASDSQSSQKATATAPSLSTQSSSSSTLTTRPCIIKVLGVGGGGGNAVNRMIEKNVDGVTFWAINTDAQALSRSLAPNILNIGNKLTRGLGAGGKSEEGAKAALENVSELKQICTGADMIFITAGMGGGTGSGAAPIIAELAKDDCGCLTVGVVTMPFAFEGKKRLQQAEYATAELRKVCDTLIVVSNDKLLQIVPDNTPVTDAFLVADDILRQGVVGISEIIVKTGLVNVDFADVRSVLHNAGAALIGIGKGTGRNRAADAAIAAISSPLLDFPIHKAKRIMFNIVGGDDIGLKEINEASAVIYENADDNANIIFGSQIDPTITNGEISITVLAADFDTDYDGDEEEVNGIRQAATTTTKTKQSSSNTSPLFTSSKKNNVPAYSKTEIPGISLRRLDHSVEKNSNAEASTKSSQAVAVSPTKSTPPPPTTTTSDVVDDDNNTKKAASAMITGRGGFKKPPIVPNTKRKKVRDFIKKFFD